MSETNARYSEEEIYLADPLADHAAIDDALSAQCSSTSTKQQED